MPIETTIMDGIARSAPMLAVALVTFLAGVMVPFPYAMERFRGFGRVMLSKLPYRPPPGVETEAALEAATREERPTGSSGEGDGGGA